MAALFLKMILMNFAVEVITAQVDVAMNSVDAINVEWEDSSHLWADLDHKDASHHAAVDLDSMA